MARRSEPGLGRMVGIYMLDDAEKWRGDHVMAPLGTTHRTVIMASDGEDYADCAWPVVVKVQAEVSREFLIERLTDLLKTVKRGFFIKTGQERERELDASIAIALSHPQGVD